MPTFPFPPSPTVSISIRLGIVGEGILQVGILVFPSPIYTILPWKGQGGRVPYCHTTYSLPHPPFPFRVLNMIPRRLGNQKRGRKIPWYACGNGDTGEGIQDGPTKRLLGPSYIPSPVHTHPHTHTHAHTHAWYTRVRECVGSACVCGWVWVWKGLGTLFPTTKTLPHPPSRHHPL